MRERGDRERERRSYVDCRPCAGGLPQPLFLGLVLRGGLRERGEILPWHCKMRNDTVSPNVAPHRPVMD